MMEKMWPHGGLASGVGGLMPPVGRITMTLISKMRKSTRSIGQRVRHYLGQGLGDFYVHPINRLMLYPFFAAFFLLECWTLWLAYMGPAFVREHLAFTIVYSLHKAVVYTACIVAADVLANRLTPAWGAYKLRRVGRQWLIWALGTAVGFVLHRTMVRSQVAAYAPEVVRYFMANPQKAIGNGAILAIFVPYWVLAVFLTLKVLVAKQRIMQRPPLPAVAQSGAAEDKSRSPSQPSGHPAGSLRLDDGAGHKTVALCDIAHITVEDHYCRVVYFQGDELKSKMVRMQLKEMMSTLPQEYFMQIHRSHVVNLGHVSRLHKDGRDHKVVLGSFDVQLPISRSRFKQLAPWLETTGITG